MTDCKDPDSSLPLVVASKDNIKIVGDMTLILEPAIGYRYAKEFDLSTKQGFSVLEDGLVEFNHEGVKLMMDEIEARRIADLIISRYDAGN